MRRFLILLVVLLPLAVQAQTMPQLSVDVPEGDVIVGQPITLNLKLLVPTWMPKPPVWPTFEVPSLLVRLPERASTPISETINGETWSGISRAYRLYPLEESTYEIPAQVLRVSYADPGKPDPLIVELTLDAIRFNAVLPQGAKGLDPPIVAKGLTLSQEIDGSGDMVTGDAITRIVTITIKGTTPILLPSVTPAVPDLASAAPVRAYPKEPVVDETEQRGELSGIRIETTTYIAQADGATDLPGITVKWFNLDSGKVETAKVEGRTLTITAPPPPPPGPADYARWAAIILGILVGIWLFVRLAGPRLVMARQQLITMWRGSERFAARQVRAALRKGSTGAIYAALDYWVGFFPALTDQDHTELDSALAEIGAARFRNSAENGSELPRQRAIDAFVKLRRVQHQTSRKHDILAPLNPL